jgi:hypothetical protein
MSENERGMHAHKLGAGGVLGLSVGFGLLLASLSGSLIGDRRARDQAREAEARRARIAARAFAGKR